MLIYIAQYITKKNIITNFPIIYFKNNKIKNGKNL